MSDRVQDFALMLGHAWRCPTCREALLEQPAIMAMGYKLSGDQRERLVDLTEDAFHTTARLAEAAGLSQRELESAIEHPRARLRHLGSVKGDFYFRPNGA